MTPPTVSILGITVKEGELRLQYELLNPASGDRMFLMNLHGDLWEQLKPPPRSQFSAQVAPVCYRREQDLLLFWAAEVPKVYSPLSDSYGPILPLTAAVGRGEKFEATIRTPLPVAEWGPYEPPERAGPNVREIEVKKVRLVVEYLLEKDAEDPPEPDDDQPGAFYVIGPTHFVQADLVSPAPIRVLERLDDFNRFGGEEPTPE